MSFCAFPNKSSMNQLANTDSLISFARQAVCRTRFFAFVLLFVASGHAALAKTGASVPWITYEAEAMTIKGGVVLGPSPAAVDKNVRVTNTFAAEASGRQCVELSGTGQYMQFTAQAAANS